MVKKIYSLTGCMKCLQAKRKYPEAEYIMIDELSSEDREKLINKCTEIGIVSAPILVDETDKILTHAEAGL